MSPEPGVFSRWTFRVTNCDSAPSGNDCDDQDWDDLAWYGEQAGGIALRVNALATSQCLRRRRLPQHRRS
jgi:hypothetical protein